MSDATTTLFMAQVEREWAAQRAAGVADTEATDKPSSVVFTLRLDPQELAALRQRAADRGLPPSVLARNLIRVGLQPPSTTFELGRACAQLQSALTAVRAALPPH